MEPQNYQSQHFQGNLPPSMTWMPGRSIEFSLDDELEALRNSPEWLTGIARKKLIQYPDFQDDTAQDEAQHPNPRTLQSRQNLCSDSIRPYPDACRRQNI